MLIHDQLDAGNIELLAASDPAAIRLRIKPDVGDRHFQWFHFQVCDGRDQALVMHIENAGKVSFPDGFKDYQAVACSDGVTWRRVPTEFDGQTLTIRHTPDSDVVSYAFFEPYSLARHQALISDALNSDRARARTLCQTPDGHPHTLLTIGEAEPGRKRLWVIARQHPGEPMAEWWVEGFLDRLLDDSDPVARALLAQAVVYLVPNMCIDGSVRGHLRCNAHGVNLNRAWAEPCAETSPEVFYVRQAMHETGMDLALDVHGDEGLPYNFFAGAEGVPSWTPDHLKRYHRFRQLLATLSPDFQETYGYEVDAAGSSDLKKCTDYLAETFGCLSVTLEMPFKDAANSPMPETGWNGERSAQLGRACVDAIWQMLPEL